MVLGQHPDHRLEDAILILAGRFAVEIDPRLIHGPAQAVFAIGGLDRIDVGADRHEFSDLFVGQHDDGHWRSPFFDCRRLLAQQHAPFVFLRPAGMGSYGRKAGISSALRS